MSTTTASGGTSSDAAGAPLAAPEAEHPPRVRWLILFGVWVVYLCFGLTTIGLAPLVAPISRDLGLSGAAMGSVLGVWQLVYIFAALPCGGLLDRLGSRRALFVGALLIAISGMMRGFAIDYWTLCLAVAIFGLGGPIVSAGAPKTVSQWFKGNERGLAMGLYITGPALGSMLGLALTNSVLMPWLDNDWRHVLQVWGAITFLGALVWIAIASHPVSRAREKRDAVAERRPQWELTLQLLRLPEVRVLLVMGMCIFMFNHSLNNWLPEMLRDGGMSASQAGFWATIPAAMGVVGSLLIPRLATPERRLPILGALAIAASVSALLLHASTGTLLAVGLVAQGIVRGSLMTVTMLTLVETRGVGERHAGTAGGLFFSAAETGGAIGPVMMGALHDATGHFDAGLWLLTSIAAVVLAGVLRLRYLQRLHGRASAAPAI